MTLLTADTVRRFSTVHFFENDRRGAEERKKFNTKIRENIGLSQNDAFRGKGLKTPFS
jgi:hypothetical protein